MRNLMGRSLAGGLVLGMALMACSMASAATTLDDLQLGETWWGDAYKPADLQGHVTLVDFWGKN